MPDFRRRVKDEDASNPRIDIFVQSSVSAAINLYHRRITPLMRTYNDKTSM